MECLTESHYQVDKIISTLSWQIWSQLQTEKGHCELFIWGFFVIKSALNSIFFNSSSVRVKATKINRHNSRPTAVDKPRESVGDDIDDSGKLTL